MCLKKIPRKAAQIGFYQCKSCGAIAKKSKKLCKPKKIKI